VGLEKTVEYFKKRFHDSFSEEKRGIG